MKKDTKLSEELNRMESEYVPLMPVEKKLIAYSLIIGIILLGLLLLISYTFFPAGH